MLNNGKKIISVFVFLLFLTLPNIARAAESIIPPECLTNTATNCGLIEFAQLFANFYTFTLKYLGALALLLFVIGGIMFMTSGGNQERITRARHILVGTTIGIFIVLGSYLIVDQFQKMLGVEDSYRLPNSQSTKTLCESNFGAAGGECRDVCPEDWTSYPNNCGHNSNQECCIPPTNP